MGLLRFDEAVASYRTAVLIAPADDRVQNDALAVSLVDFALTLVHSVAPQTPFALRRVKESRALLELACALAPGLASLRYDYAL